LIRRNHSLEKGVEMEMKDMFASETAMLGCEYAPVMLLISEDYEK